MLPFIIGGAYKKPADEWTHQPDTYSLCISDGLWSGTIDEIRKLLAKNHHDFVALELDSWGGDGDSGMVLADFVSRWDKRVVITNRCTSSCAFAALVALGQGKLWVGPYASVGVHQVYDTYTGIPDRIWTERAAKILKRYGAPKVPLDAMVRTPPSDMAVFHESQLIDMGAAALPMGWWWWLFGESDE